MGDRAGAGEARIVAAGLGFTEGPLWHAEGRLWVASISRGIVYAVDVASGATDVVAETGGNPSGLAQAADGTVWIAQGGVHAPSRSSRPAAPGIQRVRPGVKDVEDVVVRGHDAPNDCVVRDGRLWFTDPRGAAMVPEGPGGRVCSLDPEGGTVRVEVDGLRYPNGLVFDGDVLYVAETGTRRILRFRAQPDGLEALGVWHQLQDGHPDGLALGPDGRLYVAGTDGHAVYVVQPDGAAAAPIRLETGSLPTNCCLGPGGRTLFVTAARGGRVLAVDVETDR